MHTYGRRRAALFTPTLGVLARAPQCRVSRSPDEPDSRKVWQRYVHFELNRFAIYLFSPPLSNIFFFPHITHTSAGFLIILQSQTAIALQPTLPMTSSSICLLFSRPSTESPPREALAAVAAGGGQLGVLFCQPLHPRSRVIQVTRTRKAPSKLTRQRRP